MSQSGLPYPTILLVCVILLEIGAGLAVAVGPGWLRPRYFLTACLALAVFTLLTNAVFHRFWELNGFVRDLELSLFFKNVAIAGALVAIGGLSTSHKTLRNAADDHY